MRAREVPSVVLVTFVFGAAFGAGSASGQDGLDELYNVPAPGASSSGDGAAGQDGDRDDGGDGDREAAPDAPSAEKEGSGRGGGRSEADRRSARDDGEADPRGDDDEDDDPGLFGAYFPLTAYEELDPRAGEIQPYFFLGGLAPLGQVWLPILMSPDPAPDGYGLGALWLLLAHLGPHALCAAMIPCSLLFFAVPIVGPLIFLGAVLLNLANAGCFLANNFYFTPVALLNEYDRRVRTEAGLSTAEGRSPDRRVDPIRY